MICNEAFIGVSDHFAEVCVLEKGHDGNHSSSKHEPAEPVSAPQGLSNLPPEQMTAHSGTINGKPSADSTPQKKYVFDNFCEGCANPMDCSIKGRCLIPEANSTRPEPLSAEQELQELRGWKDSMISMMPPMQEIGRALGIRRLQSIHDKILPGILKLKHQLKMAAAPRTQGNELECKHCGQTIRPAKDSKVRGYWIGTNNYLTCPNNVGQPHEPLAAQPQPAPRPACPDQWLVWSHKHGVWWKPNKCGYTPAIEHAGRYSLVEALKCCKGRSTREDGLPNEVPVPSPELIELFTAIPVALPLAQAADEVLAELSLLNGKFTQKQSVLFDKVREFTAIPAQKEEE